MTIAFDFGSRIAELRNDKKITQAELADKLNYSDKTLSKWERAESIPDVITLKQMADLFGITIDTLINEDIDYVPKTIKKGKSKRTKFSVISLSVGIVWLVACISFLILGLIKESHPNIKIWLSFIYALPISCIVLLVYASIWGNKYYLFSTTTLLLWTTALSIHLSLINAFTKIWLVYVVCIPLQIMAFIFFIILMKRKK